MESDDIVYIKYKSRKWFEANSFQDYDASWWETEKLKEDYEIGEDYEVPWVEDDLSMSIPDSKVGKLVPDFEKSEVHEWGIEKKVTLQDNPEYFI